VSQAANYIIYSPHTNITLSPKSPKSSKVLAQLNAPDTYNPQVESFKGPYLETWVFFLPQELSLPQRKCILCISDLLVTVNSPPIWLQVPIFCSTSFLPGI
jgi:hypothetical protein